MVGIDLSARRATVASMDSGDPVCIGTTDNWGAPSADVLSRLKRVAEAHLGEDVEEAVIVLPTSTTQLARREIHNTARHVGLAVARVVDPLSVAAFAYGLDRGNDQYTVLVVDLAGRSFDCAVAEIGCDVAEMQAMYSSDHPQRAREAIDDIPPADQAREGIRTVLRQSGYSRGDLDELVVVGRPPNASVVVDVVTAHTGLKPAVVPKWDEAVAAGAALLAGVFTGALRDALLLTVEPLPLRTHTAANGLVTLRPSNTTIPTRRMWTFTTETEYQTSLQIDLFEGVGERPRSVGRVEISDVPPAPLGVARVEVTFDISPGSELTVSAKDKYTKADYPAELTLSADSE